MVAGEEDVIGEHTFGHEAAHAVEVPNRDLLLEFCIGNSLLVANTFMPGCKEDKATYMEPGVNAMDAAAENGFNMLDLLVCDEEMLSRVMALRSNRAASFATDHFLVQATLLLDYSDPTEQ